jgi:hypothetical protein
VFKKDVVTFEPQVPAFVSGKGSAGFEGGVGAGNGDSYDKGFDFSVSVSFSPAHSVSTLYLIKHR